MIEVEIETLRRLNRQTFVDSETKTFPTFADVLDFLRTDTGIKGDGFDQIIISNIEE